MNSIKFWTLIVLSSLTLVFSATEIVLNLMIQDTSIKLAGAQQTIGAGQAKLNAYKAIAQKVAEVSQQTHDAKLVDLLTRQGFTITVNPPASVPTPEPTTPSSTH